MSDFQFIAIMGMLGALWLEPPRGDDYERTYSPVVPLTCMAIVGVGMWLCNSAAEAVFR